MEALAEQVSVSKDTIRRDLIRLEKEGHLKRTHGGAISVQSGNYLRLCSTNSEASEKNKRLPKSLGKYSKQASIFLIHQPRWKQLFERWKIVRFTR